MKRILGVLAFATAVLLFNAESSDARGKKTRAYGRAATTNIFAGKNDALKKDLLDCDRELLYCYTQEACESKNGEWHVEWTENKPNDSDAELKVITEWVNPEGDTISGICFPKNIVDDISTGECSAESPSNCDTKEACEAIEGFGWNDSMAAKCQTKEDLCGYEDRGTWNSDDSSCECQRIGNTQYIYSESQYICLAGNEIYDNVELREEVKKLISDQIDYVVDLKTLKGELETLKTDVKNKKDDLTKMRVAAWTTGTAAVGTTTWATVSVIQNINLKKCLCSQAYRKMQKDRSKDGKRDRCAKLLTKAVIDDEGNFTTPPTIGGEEFSDEGIAEFCKDKDKYGDKDRYSKDKKEKKKTKK